MLIPDPKQRGILIVDDELGPREALRFILKTGSLSNIHFATNGQEALAAVSTLGPDLYLILLDMRMPVMDGMTFLGRLAGRQDTPPLGVIATTGHPSDSGRAEFLAAATPSVRPLHYLAKPYEIQDVL